MDEIRRSLKKKAEIERQMLKKRQRRSRSGESGLYFMMEQASVDPSILIMEDFAL